METEKKKHGRPTKISPETIRRIEVAIAAGNYVETAAAYAGLSKDTIYAWMKRGRRTLDDIKSGKLKRVPKAEEIFVILAKKLSEAMAKAEARDVAIIGKAASGGATISEEKIVYDKAGNVVEKIITNKTILPQWQAAAWRLERKFPKKWGRRIAIRKDEGNKDESPESFAKAMRDEFGGVIGMIGCGSEEDQGAEEQDDASPDSEVEPRAKADTSSTE